MRNCRPRVLFGWNLTTSRCPWPRSRATPALRRLHRSHCQTHTHPLPTNFLEPSGTCNTPINFQLLFDQVNIVRKLDTSPSSRSSSMGTRNSYKSKRSIPKGTVERSPWRTTSSASSDTFVMHVMHRVSLWILGTFAKNFRTTGENGSDFQHMESPLAI